MQLNPNRTSRAALLVSVLVAALLFVIPGIPGARATEDPTSERLAGATRFHTAADIATETFPDGAANAVIAYGFNFPDALAASYLAGFIGGPILLSDVNDVPTVTLDALDTLNTETCYVVGGTAVISAAAVDELESECDVARIAGDNRYETAAEIADTPPEAHVGELGTKGRTAIVTTGENFADALAIGPIADAEGYPLLLTQPSALSDEAAEALDDLNIDHVLIPGGTAAVSQAVEDEIEDGGMTTQRLAGNNRFETAVEIAEFGAEELGDDLDHVNVASGIAEAFPDALALAPHGAAESPTLLCQAVESCGATTLGFIEDNAATIASIHVAGGTARISEDAEDELVAAATTEGDAPEIIRAEAVDGDTIVLTMSEAVEPEGDDLDQAQFEYDADGSGSGAAVTPDSAEIAEDGLTITLTFDADTVVVDAAGDTITYDDDDDSEADDGDVVDIVGNPLADETQTVASPPPPDAGPELASATTLDSSHVVVTLTEPGDSQGGNLEASQFTYEPGGNIPLPATAATSAVLSADGLNIALTFPADTITQPEANQLDSIAYTDSNAAVDNGDLVDEEGNQATDGAVPADTATPPEITSATPTNGTTIVVEFAQAVRGYGGSIAANQFTYDADGDCGLGSAATASGASLSGDGMTITLTFAAVEVDSNCDVLFYNDNNDDIPETGDVVAATNASPMLDGEIPVGNSGFDATPPEVVSVTAVSTTELRVVFTEEVIVAGGDENAALPQFRYDKDGALAGPYVTPDTIDLVGDLVILTFGANEIDPAAGSDIFAYVDDDPDNVDDGSEQPDVTDPQGAPLENTGNRDVGNGPDGAPTILDADPVSSTRIDLWMDEPVQPEGAATLAADQFTYDADGAGSGEPEPAITATIVSDDTIQLTFPADTIQDIAASSDVVTYTDILPEDPEGPDPPPADTGDVEDKPSGTNNMAGETEPVDGRHVADAPTIQSAEFGDSDDVIIVTMDQSVLSFGGGDLDASQWVYTIADLLPVTAESAVIDNTNPTEIILTFPSDLTTPGELSYTDDDADPDIGDVISRTGDELANDEVAFD